MRIRKRADNEVENNPDLGDLELLIQLLSEIIVKSAIASYHETSNSLPEIQPERSEHGLD